MKSTWTSIVLTRLNFDLWLNSSYLYRFLNLVSAWRSQSWLLQWSEEIGASLLALILILAPFVSTGLIGMLLIAVALYWILTTISESEPLGITPIHVLVFLYWGVAAIATVLSPVRAAALDGFIKLTLYLMMFALGSRIMRSPKLSNWLITSALLSSLIVSGYGIRQQFFGVEQLATWNDPNSVLAKDTRVYSYLGNPNLLGSYLLPAIALSIVAVFVWSSWIQKTLAVVLVGINSACLFFTDSRGAWLAMLALASVLFLLLYWWWREFLPRFWRVWLLPLFFGGLGGLIIVAILGVESIRIRFFSIFAGREDSSNNFRQVVWDTVGAMIKDYPLTGIGPGNETFKAIYPRYMDSRYPALSAYSIYLEHIVEIGLVGFSSFIWLIVVTFNHGITQVNRLRQSRNVQGLWVIAAIAAIWGLLVHGLVDTVWYRPQVSTLWWFMLAIIASQFEGMRDEG
ncbi:putative bicarbonate transporter, IctB family [Xenococcus sp. PCC 7305]|uniref:IctB family putative bicarbonate transporter n=1 Tax=Xenococcus sp. PCC 7305 TaxID=102125 RepID=UPI0002AC482A|nr:IctB family putative bicarbonate transporter [Xenococcus sp. PCC 7305]ELS03593.1 putative bicarbonate transporter, IctB family [Xenococcus sp. PCC 7305]